MATSNISLLCLVVVSLCFVSVLSPVSCGQDGDNLATIINATVAAANAVRRAGIDTALQRYSFLALSDAEVGVIYNVTLTPHFDGIEAEAVRMSAATLVSNGMTFNEVGIPGGTQIINGKDPTSTSLSTSSSMAALVYRKITNFTVYDLPDGYIFAGPVIGIVAYSMTPGGEGGGEETLLEVNVEDRNDPLVFTVPVTEPAAEFAPCLYCVYLDADGTVTLRNISSPPNICYSEILCDVSLAMPLDSGPTVKSGGLQIGPTSSSGPFSTWRREGSPHSHSNGWKVALGATFGIAIAIVLAFLVVHLEVMQRVRTVVLQKLGGNHEELLLQTSLPGRWRVPTAASMRTQPTIENSYAASL